GAAAVSDESRQPQARDPPVPRHYPQLLRDAVRRSLCLGRDRRDAANSLRADLRDMIRPILTEIGIFLLPFAAYAVFLVAARYNLLDTSSWPIHIIGGLVGIALALTVAVLVLFANFSGAP